jgi:hypothetical protein
MFMGLLPGHAYCKKIIESKIDSAAHGWIFIRLFYSD